MNTDELVKMLATGAGPVERSKCRNRYIWAIVLSLLISAAMMFSLLGILPNIGEVIMWPSFWVKVVFSASLAVAGILLVTRLARPGYNLGYAWVAAFLPVALIWVFASYTLISACPADREELFFGETWTVCPILIVMLSIPMLVGMLWAIKDYAPTRLGLTGASCGLFSGAMGALIYTLHCPEMTAPFIGTWYLLGIFVTTVLGWIIGRKLLRW